MKPLFHWLLAAALFLLLPLATGCDSEEPEGEGPGEEELITRVLLTLTRTDGPVGTATAEASSPSGIGGGTGLTVGTLRLVAGATYSGTVQLFNGTEAVTAEVEDEADEHQFFYTASGALAGKVTFTPTDRDSNNFPVGLAFTVAVAGDALGTGTVHIQLGHYDEQRKDGTTVSSETDLDFEMPLEVVAITPLP
jgi:hypothetical protein